MTNRYTSQVNRQLYAANAHLKLLPKPPLNGNQRIVAQALLESALFHLILAYKKYLRELADNYQLANSDSIDSFLGLRQAFVDSDKTPAESNELEVLVNEGWIGDALASFEIVGEESRSKKLEQQTELLIPLANLGTAYVAKSKPLTQQLLMQWIESFRELINRHRDIMVEY